MSIQPDGITLQNAEFATMARLAEQWRRLQLTAVVDDDYSGVRSDYERALSDFIKALAGNRATALFMALGLTVTVTGSRAQIAPYQSLPHISITNFARALRWHPQGLDSWSLSDWGVALAGEVGELCNVIKKLNRIRDGLTGNKETPENLKTEVGREIADVFIYLDLLARRAGFNLEDVVREKFNSTSERLGFPERL